MFNNIESIFILSGIGLYCLITLISNIVFWVEYFKAKEHKIELNSHLKKDNSEGSNTDYLETRNTTEEVKKQECKSGCVDNQDDTLRGSEDGE